MYSSSYSRAKFGLEAREHKHKPKGKSCGYYMRIVFFFSSLIQSLIIVSLVLFLIYGQPEKSAEEKMVEELELNFNRISENNFQLQKEKGELAAQLGAHTAEKTALETELAIQKQSCPRLATSYQPSPPCNSAELKKLQNLNSKYELDINNFTHVVQYLSREKDNAIKDRDTHRQDASSLRSETTMLKEQLTTYTKKCKEDFAQSLDGIQSVTSDFLTKIDRLFLQKMTFHLTCESQKAEMETIRNSCTNLSRDVEKRFQLYLNSVGDRVCTRYYVELLVRSSLCEQQYVKALADAAELQRTHDNTVGIVCY
uniref:Plasmalemma vesicle associated protein b n=1 Tax=Gasterosteus aculeatus aculeatus TaxID=481459 RepID=A0AAQ4R1S9_GASAC